MNGVSSRWALLGSSAPKDVRTTPGCSALAVTKVACSFLALVLIGAAAADHTVRLDQLLTPAALRLLAHAEIVGIDDLLVPGSPASPAPTEMFRPDADLGPLLKVLAANDPAMLRPRTPVLIVQGHDDPIVALRSTDHIARSLHASGAMLAYHRFPGLGHYDLIQAAHTGNVRWIDARKTQGGT